MEHVGRVFVQIQDWRSEGRGWRVIAAMLNRSGVGAPRGGMWYPATAQRVYEAGKRSSVQLDLIEGCQLSGKRGEAGYPLISPV